MIRALLAALFLCPAASASSFEEQAASATQAAVAAAKSTELLSWTRPGGDLPFLEEHAVSRAGEYSFVRRYQGWMNKTEKSCAAPSGSEIELQSRLRHADVVAALRTPGAKFGWDTTCHDGRVLVVKVGASSVQVGRECPRDPSELSCQKTCVDAPQGLRELAELLDRLEDKMEKVPACAQAKAW